MITTFYVIILSIPHFIRVVFNSVTSGEFWYQLDLFADNPKSTSISPISCELGK